VSYYQLMPASSAPLRWPNAWSDPAALDLVRGTAIDCLLIDNSDQFTAVRERAREAGLRVVHPDAPPSGISIVKGVWPGIHWGRGSNAHATAGPTGEPWLDSNGWLVRLTRALAPDREVWVDAPPEAGNVIAAESYGLAFVDSAAYGGRWIISLDPPLASALAAGKDEARKPWERITRTAAFFAAHKPWADYTPVSVVGVISDFSGGNEFFGRELLNLMARTGLHYRILPKDRPLAATGLRALTYTDEEPPPAGLQKQIEEFVNAGGVLIAARCKAPNTKPLSSPVDKFSVYASGKGRLIIAKEPPADPWAFANDCAVLVSHRHDLVRFWNAGAAAAYYTKPAGGAGALVHLLFYWDRGPDAASVRIAGRFGAATAATIDNPRLTGVRMLQQKDAVEIHLPPAPQYVALELEARALGG
jgi:hypothetical protein